MLSTSAATHLPTCIFQQCDCHSAQMQSSVYVKDEPHLRGELQGVALQGAGVVRGRHIQEGGAPLGEADRLQGDPLFV